MLLTNFILNNFQYFAVPQQGASQLNFNVCKLAEVQNL